MILIFNGGLVNVCNIGIKEFMGVYILFFDVDDKLVFNYIRLVMEVFVEDLKLKVVYCNVEKFGVVYGLWKL